MLRHRLLVPLLASAIGVGASLVVAELGLRLLGISYPSFYRVDPQRGYGLRPGASGWWTREGRGWVRINSAGFRHQELAAGSPPAGQLRIAVLGDSFSEALQVDEPRTWPAGLRDRLQSMPACPLRRDSTSVEVLNFGVGGYGTGQALLTWRHLARAYRPQLVLLLLYPGNDFSDNEPINRSDRPVFRLDDRGRLWQDDSYKQSAGYRWRTSPPGQLADALMNHSRVLQLLNESKNRLLAQQRLKTRPASTSSMPPRTALAPPTAWAVTEALLTSLNRDVQASGAKLVVVSASSPEQLWPERQERPADAFAQERRLGTLLQARGIPYLALGPTLQAEVDRSSLVLHGFPGQEPGQGHWNAAGHRLAATAIAAWLCRP